MAMVIESRGSNMDFILRECSTARSSYTNCDDTNNNIKKKKTKKHKAQQKYLAMSKEERFSLVSLCQ